MKLRELRADEIRVRAVANKGGVKLSLWKYPNANLSVLDDSVGITNRKVSYSDNGKRCTLSVRVNEEWISNDGYAFEGSPDNEPNDALNHAGLAWGIGKELYCAPEMFIYKDDLKGFREGTETEAPICKDEFRVSKISFENGGVSSVTIEICTYGNPYSRKVFTAKQNFFTEKAPEPAPAAPQESSIQSETKALFPDEEIILIGNCKGKPYGEVKETPVFKSFLEWAKKSTTSYSDPKQADQLKRFKTLAA